jgi:N-acetylmuramoyl-L-alanine amidase
MKTIGFRTPLAPMFVTLVAALMLTVPAGAQQVPVRQNFVRLVVPESDTVTANSGTYRLSAGTAPGNRLTINGAPLKVYPSGATAGILNLNVGENRFTLTATSPKGDSVSKSFLVIRAKSAETTPDSVLAIDTIMTEPSDELWLNEDDRLEVQFKGTPGCKASCDLGIPMAEVKPAYAHGLGVSTGGYTP